LCNACELRTFVGELGVVVVLADAGDEENERLVFAVEDEKPPASYARTLQPITPLRGKGKPGVHASVPECHLLWR
jgi:hypothetical protein